MRKLDSRTIVAGQIDPEEVPALAAAGVTMIVNNRPDGEEPGQPPAYEIEAAARAAGVDYRFLPVGAAGISDALVDGMADAIGASQGTLLAFCRSGQRSTYLWTLAQQRLAISGGSTVVDGQPSGAKEPPQP